MRVALSMSCLPVVAFALSCAPKADQGECSAVQQCPRGQECDFDVSVCVDIEANTDATEDPAPMSFSNKAVPFFRGQVCTVREVKAGAAFPVLMTPCLHPCVEWNAFKFKHSWSCVGADCEAFGLLWLNASSGPDGCPADAFGRFDESMCVYPQWDEEKYPEFRMQAELSDGSAVQGTMKLEAPFVSNADMAEIAANADDTDLIQDIIRRYPEDPSRIVGGMPISMLTNDPEPPATCGPDGSMCDCFDVGF